MDIMLAFNSYPETRRHFSLVLVWSTLNRSHFDYWADFHTDSATMFAYLQKSARRLVNCHQSRYGWGRHVLLFAWAAASAGEVEFITSAHHTARGSRDTRLTSAHTYWVKVTQSTMKEPCEIWTWYFSWWKLCIAQEKGFIWRGKKKLKGAS